VLVTVTKRGSCSGSAGCRWLVSTPVCPSSLEGVLVVSSVSSITALFMCGSMSATYTSFLCPSTFSTILHSR
jgi:hypothetical protein